MKLATLFAGLAACSTVFTAPAAAVDGQILITQGKALNGGVTPGDAAGFPISISRTGSYKLATELMPRPNTSAIVVDANDVTIDLNGFRMNGAGAAWYGVIGKRGGLTVRNGTIRGFKFDGVRSEGARLIVEDMRIAENGGRGISESGPSAGFARIVDSTISRNFRTGIECSVFCHIAGNNVSFNGRGSDLGNINIVSGTVLGNTIIESDSFGIYGTAKVGFGSNTIIDNYNGPTNGAPVPLSPNTCAPQPC
jgi:hypothetical protein